MSAAPEKKPYTSPKLTVLGDIRDLTLGASPGIGDSGSINFQAPTGEDSGGPPRYPMP